MRATIFSSLLLFAATWAFAGSPATQGVGGTEGVGKLPHIQVDVPHKEVRVECEAVKADYPLEFLAVVRNSNEYEAIVRSDARPADVHLALLMLGLKPGQPVHYSESTKTWLPPTGPPVRIWFEYDNAGKHERVPATRWMRDVKTHQEPAPCDWVFAGSRSLDDGSYGADTSGHLVSVINNELSVLDVPAIKATALEARDWERNPDVMPPTGTPVTMILSIGGDEAAAPLPTTRSAAPNAASSPPANATSPSGEPAK